MKKLVQAFSIILVVSIGLIFYVNYLNNTQGYSSGNTLTIFNWGDYIDDELITEFEELYGIKVIYETFDSNEAMLTKIGQGGTTYDIAIPSEYTIEKMIAEGLLYEIDHSKIPNLQNIDPNFLDLDFDPANKYSIPYFWGSVGIVYNPEIVGDMEFNSWDDLWDPALKNEILLTDGAREVLGFALNSLGYSLNDTNKDHLREAVDKLNKLTPNIKAIIGDEIRQLIATGEAGVGVVWSGTYQEILWENEDVDFQYVVPKEGSNLWFDNMVIPKTAKNIEAAHQFINFMLDPENAARNAEYVGYSSPNVTALEYMDPELAGDESLYPSEEVIDNLEIYKNLGKEMVSYYNELFLEFKIHRK